MCRHTFPALVLYTPAAMVDGFVAMGFTKTTFTLSGTMCVSTTTVGVHGVEKVRNVMGRRDVDVT